jgi:hypothetical protein
VLGALLAIAGLDPPTQLLSSTPARVATLPLVSQVRLNAARADVRLEVLGDRRQPLRAIGLVVGAERLVPLLLR